ncbi:MAG: DUF2933 domain-containing protein [Candidatus Dormibacteria bacterium]
MSQLFFLLLIAGCPLMMFFMMRGMHGGHEAAGDSPTARIVDAAPTNARISELEREVARLREAQQATLVSGAESHQ